MKRGDELELETCFISLHTFYAFILWSFFFPVFLWECWVLAKTQWGL